MKIKNIARNICLVFLSILLVKPALASIIQHCVKVDKATIHKLFDRWNDSLKTHDAEQVDRNYTKDAVLLPTVSNTPRVTRSQRIDYFKQFLIKQPVGKIDSSTINIGCNKAVDTGLYTFTMKNGEKIHARYTFIYRWDGFQWLISSHHSSGMPEYKTQQK